MNRIRPSAVAGLFYPARAADLEHFLTQQIDHSPHTTTAQKTHALIVPHAAYCYSGHIAAKAYASLVGIADQIDRVVLVGPSHNLDIEGVAISEADCFATPLGHVPIDKTVYPRLSRISGVSTTDLPHQDEHCLEVQLPYLQHALNHFDIVPVLTGKASPALIAEVIGSAAEGARSLIIISSDLSHYLDYDTARRMDQFTSQAIISLDNHDIDASHACGSVAIRGFLEYAKAQHYTGQIMALGNSGDIAGRKDSVVGYGAYRFN